MAGGGGRPSDPRGAGFLTSVNAKSPGVSSTQIPCSPFPFTRGWLSGPHCTLNLQRAQHSTMPTKPWGEAPRTPPPNPKAGKPHLNKVPTEAGDHGQEGQPSPSQVPRGSAPTEGPTHPGEPTAAPADAHSPAFTPSATRKDVARGHGLGVLVAEGKTASMEQPGGFLEEGAFKLTGGEREVGCGQGRGSAVGGSMEHPGSREASLAGGRRGFHSPPGPAQLLGVSR